MLNIRTATEADVARITEIYRDAVVHGAATYELEPPTQDEMLARFRNLMEQRYPYIVGESEGVVVGYAYAGPFRARPAYRFIVEDSIYIAPEAKGRGVGKSLLNALIERCRADGYRQFVAVIGDGGPQSPSVRLHEAVGMTHCGVLTGSGYKHERWLDTTFMQLALNGGNELPPDPDSVPETVFNASR
jgi:L-amino acid N-acyltransferase YncA